MVCKSVWQVKHQSPGLYGAPLTSVGIAGSYTDGHLRFGVRRLDAALCGWYRTAYRTTVEGFKLDRLAVVDAFDSQTPAPSPEKSGVKPPHSK
ncbi:MAG: hypothetical protein A2498_13735 [Lentisphaerae bacterium RIFOXYC12_FULL_60_16]|nr:MAG: hypothetical protein A2498_13735 [Lentisphaerae bacterium RIFOXYC12_FULL_60_16]